MAKKKYYAVKVGYNIGVYKTWNECKAQIDGYSGAVYKSFDRKIDAFNFIGITDKVTKNFEDEVIAYIDGSYNSQLRLFSCGVVILEKNEVITLKGSSDNNNLVDMRNVAGELMGMEMLFKWIEQKYNTPVLVKVHYDYAGIENWATNLWKANKEGTKAYQMLVKEFIASGNEIDYIKIKSHSGNEYNDLADKIAREAGRNYDYLVDELKISNLYNKDKDDYIINDDVGRKETDNAYDRIFKEEVEDQNDISTFYITFGRFRFTEKQIIRFIKKCWRLDGHYIKDIDQIISEIDFDERKIKWIIKSNKKDFDYEYRFK